MHRAQTSGERFDELGAINAWSGSHFSSTYQTTNTALRAELVSHKLPFTACAVATSCCISDVPFQWEGRNFDPPQLPHFHPIFLKLKTKKHIRDTNPHAKFGKDRFTGGRLGDHPNFGRTFWATLFIYFFFVFFAQRPGRTARRTATVEGSNGVFPAKEVPFGGLNNEK